MVSKPGTAMDVVVLYSAGHLGSAITINKLIEMTEINVVGVVKARPLSLSWSGRSRIRQQLKKTGWKFASMLLWQRGIQALGYLLAMVLPIFPKRLKPAWKIAADNDIPVFHCRNVNDEDCLGFVAQIKPDLLVSAYFSQILARPMISLPGLGVLNIHPGWLPAYRGAMAYFWVLKNDSDRAGVSVHWIDDGIDTGKLLARRSFLIKPDATQETVLMYTAVIGAVLTRRIVRRLLAGKEPGQDIIDDRETGQYYPMPGELDFETYFKHRRFFRIRDVLGLIFMRRKP